MCLGVISTAVCPLICCDFDLPSEQFLDHKPVYSISWVHFSLHFSLSYLLQQKAEFNSFSAVPVNQTVPYRVHPPVSLPTWLLQWYVGFGGKKWSVHKPQRWMSALAHKFFLTEQTNGAVNSQYCSTQGFPVPRKIEKDFYQKLS